MSDGYSVAKTGKLKLKGESGRHKHKSKKSKRDKSSSSSAGASGSGSNKIDARVEDELNHGGAWLVENARQMSGTIVIELKEQAYMHGLDNGLFVMGAPHAPKEPPDTCELLTAIRVNDDKNVALKSAYGKYLSVNLHGLVVGRSEAIGSNEYFQVEIDYDYEGRKYYLKASNGKYVGVNSEGDVVAGWESKCEQVELQVRSLGKKEDARSAAKRELPAEEQSEDLRNVEYNYVMKFQKFQDKKVKLSKADEGELSEAKQGGYLHEKLLDRREKMKADRYCK